MKNDNFGFERTAIVSFIITVIVTYENVIDVKGVLPSHTVSISVVLEAAILDSIAGVIKLSSGFDYDKKFFNYRDKSAEYTHYHILAG
jgi:hypothetical protein